VHHLLSCRCTRTERRLTGPALSHAINPEGCTYWFKQMVSTIHLIRFLNERLSAGHRRKPPETINSKGICFLRVPESYSIDKKEYYRHNSIIKICFIISNVPKPKLRDHHY